MHAPLSRQFQFIFAFLTVCLLTACGGGSGGTSGQSPVTVTAAEFAAKTVALWKDFDYATQNPDGQSDSDGDGEIDANGGVVVIETLRSLGYDLPKTTVHGLAENFYSDYGYDLQSNDGLTVVQTSFEYTLPTTITQDDLINGRWELLEVGDLIFIDFDKDLIYELVAIYLGGPYTLQDSSTTDNAVLIDSDYYDSILVLALDNYSEIVYVDIQYGYATVRRLNFDAF